MRRRKPFRQRVSEAWSALLGASAAPFTGAQSNRLTFDWARAPLSADREIYGNIGKLKARGRELVRNNAHAAQALRLYADNVIGPKGIGLQCRIKNNRKRLETETNELVERAWRDWGRALHCSSNGRNSWVDIQRHVMQVVPCEGEVVIRLIEDGRPPYGLSLQLLDTDLLDETYNVPAGAGTNEIRMSVELDRHERPVAYHFLHEHPEALNRRGVSGSMRERTRIAADQIIHLYRTERLGRTRGVSWFAPVLFNLRMLGAYQEAEVVAARIAASKIGVIYTPPENFGAQAAETAASEPQLVDVEPGSLWRPLPGERIEGWNPEHPTSQYNDFVKGMLRSVASGLGLSYASLSGDLEGTSYASGRTGLLQERDHYRALQGWLIEYLHTRVFERWLAWAGLMGIVEVGKAGAVLKSIAWQPRGWSWVDPAKDAAASETEIANGLNSRSRILAEQGQDYEEVLAELKAEQEMAQEAGVVIAPAPKAPVDSAGTPDDDVPKKKPA